MPDASGPRKLTVVVPFLNEVQNLPILHERLSAVMATQPEAFELLLVDDGSTDGSAEWAAAKAKEDPRVRLIRLSRNFGHQIAITAGMDYADGDAVVIIDADLQDPPEVIPDLLSKWREGFEVVYAVRRSREGETWMKKFLAASFYRVFHAMAKVDVPEGSPRAAPFHAGVDVLGGVPAVRGVLRAGFAAWGRDQISGLEIDAVSL